MSNFAYFFFKFYCIKSTFFIEQPSDLKAKYKLLKVSQKKHSMVLLAMVSKFQNYTFISSKGKSKSKTCITTSYFFSSYCSYCGYLYLIHQDKCVFEKQAMSVIFDFFQTFLALFGHFY